MTEEQFKNFTIAINEFKEKVNNWNNTNRLLKNTIRNINNQSNPYLKTTLKKAVIYNSNLGKIVKTDKIKFILVLDNPGVEEQAEEKYLIGRAGKTARSFFLNYLQINDFDKEVLVLNKTPIHTPKTNDLAKLKKEVIFDEAQIFMADLTFNLYNIFNCELWLLGITHIGKGKMFEPYLNKLSENFGDERNEKIKLLKHFSYGGFKNDFTKEEKTSLTKRSTLQIIQSVSEKRWAKIN